MEFSIDEAAAVKALGSLFKLTEVHLWDDGSTEDSYFHENNKPVNGGAGAPGKMGGPETNGFLPSSEDAELARQLNEFGLPLAFRTNKENSNRQITQKRKELRQKNQNGPKEIDGRLLGSTIVSEESQHAAVLLDYTVLDQTDRLKCDSVVDLDGSERANLASSVTCMFTPNYEHVCTEEDRDLRSNNELDSSCVLGKISPVTITVSEANDVMHDFDVTDLHLDEETSAKSCAVSENSVSDGRKLEEERLTSFHTRTALVEENGTGDPADDVTADVIQDADVAACSEFFEIADYEETNSRAKGYSGEWVPYWDEFYMRTYFCNVKTEESTWDPPAGLEHLAFGSIASESIKAVGDVAESDNGIFDLTPDELQIPSCSEPNLDSAEEYRDEIWSLDQQGDEAVENLFCAGNTASTKTKKRKNRVRRTKSDRKLSVSSEELQEFSEEFPPIISKYWCQRYLLFSRYDHGIKMDVEGWFSVTPEILAQHHASRCGNGTIIDFFTGVGGNAIQFAQRSRHVVAIDIDPMKIDYAQQNAAIYGVDDHIDFINADSFSLAPKLKADTIFMSPPWGGPDYVKVIKFDINTMLKPCKGQFLFDIAKGIASRIVMFLPRNVDINQLAELSLSATPPWSLEVEKNFVNGRLKAVTAYFSEQCFS